MLWTRFFNSIVVINLPERTDRLSAVTNELHGHNITFNLVRPVQMADPRESLYETEKGIIESAIHFGYNNVLIFEDDVKFLIDPTEIMRDIIERLKYIQWDIFYLGVNAPKKFSTLRAKNILPLIEGYSTHAMALSRNGMEKFLTMPKELPVDVAINKYIISKGNCYCSYPMIATQRNGYSDIEKKEVQYARFLENRFTKNTQHLV